MPVFGIGLTELLVFAALFLLVVWAGVKRLRK
jgi:hypothetical protein